jgi:predicted esterase
MPNMKLVLPTAPKMHTKVAGHTTAWHDIEDFSNLMAIKFGGIETSLQFIKDIIDKEKTYIPLEKIIVGGFSQGGALALYCGAKIPNLGGIVCLSGFVPKMTELAEVIFLN